ncbi:hypothetical protein CRENBAI_001756 [Crenichthys baileyi]|uniref:Uncharacterized protein n=1 Tax=Crenichthys baileyi TaxID=28760 RepID=A0AAV9R1U2_9TELE
MSVGGPRGLASSGQKLITEILHPLSATEEPLSPGPDVTINAEKEKTKKPETKQLSAVEADSRQGEGVSPLMLDGSRQSFEAQLERLTAELDPVYDDDCQKMRNQH